ncbi:MAG: hypothetical protein HY704_10275 [Gemmatimonadetes bacterium]|nr:hypothetical protein [Gemmatimonadota bacterium]
MKERSEDGVPRPLPRDWLPDPHPPEGAPEWDARVGRILAAADPELQRLGNRRAVVGTWCVLGLLWKPAAALAVAATALLLLTGRSAAFPEPSQGLLSLSLIAVEGDPVALWEASWEPFGIEADPVLALIAFQEQGDVTGTGMPATTPEGENR